MSRYPNSKGDKHRAAEGAQFGQIFGQWLDDRSFAATSKVYMEPTDPTDADLVADTLAGDREAFAQLYDRHARIVRAMVAGTSGDWSAVDDMAQESFLRAYRSLARLREPGRFGPWIVGIARLVGRERRRSLRRDRHEFREGELPEAWAPEDLESAVQDCDRFELVMKKMAELDERERLAIHAFFLDQRDARQAAELFGLSRSGFYALVQRAVARLAELIEANGTEERKVR